MKVLSLPEAKVYETPEDTTAAVERLVATFIALTDSSPAAREEQLDLALRPTWYSSPSAMRGRHFRGPLLLHACGERMEWRARAQVAHAPVIYVLNDNDASSWSQARDPRLRCLRALDLLPEDSRDPAVLMVLAELERAINLVV